MTPEALEPAVQFGLPADDPLAARLFPPLPGAVRWGLERTERILAAVGHPHRSYPVLHVGGTNGKGSVARTWAGILTAAGLRTGLYTSPHLVSFRERILVDGRPLPDDLLEEWSTDLRPLFLREGTSFFEAATALAFRAFALAEVDVAVIEVGLGGRLDATNVVSPVLTAITNVTSEHTEMLGGSVSAIAREKAGILKPGVPAFTAADDPAVLSVLRDEAASRGVLLRRIGQPGGEVSLDGCRFRLDTARWDTLELASPMCGRHQMRNIALAVRSLEALPPRIRVTSGAVREGVLRTRIPGRFQVEPDEGRRWVLDVAHNPDGIRAFVAALTELVPRPAGVRVGSLEAAGAPRIGVVGILADKAWPEMLAELACVLDVIVLTVPPGAPSGRRWDPHAAAATLVDAALADRADGGSEHVRVDPHLVRVESGSVRVESGRVRVEPGRVRVEPELTVALDLARDLAGRSGTVVVTGSLHTVGAALSWLGRIPREALP